MKRKLTYDQAMSEFETRQLAAKELFGAAAAAKHRGDQKESERIVLKAYNALDIGDLIQFLDPREP
jgi:hypothetical protein